MTGFCLTLSFIPANHPVSDSIKTFPTKKKKKIPFRKLAYFITYIWILLFPQLFIGTVTIWICCNALLFYIFFSMTALPCIILLTPLSCLWAIFFFVGCFYRYFLPPSSNPVRSYDNFYFGGESTMEARISERKNSDEGWGWEERKKKMTKKKEAEHESGRKKS